MTEYECNVTENDMVTDMLCCCMAKICVRVMFIQNEMNNK